ncbi:MAG: SH3 domain-containing protein [Verrucomicrobiia bacterium]
MNSFTHFHRWHNGMLGICLAAGLPLAAQADSLNEPAAAPAPTPVAAPVLKASAEGQGGQSSPSLAVGNHGIVKGTRSNVRARPGLKAEPIVQLSKGESVTIVERKTVTENGKAIEWLRIQLPAGAKCFVSAHLVANGVVNVSDVYVRCGPSTNHRDVGKLVKGDRVEVVKTEGTWLQIKPTAQCTGWIAAELVEITPEPVAPEVTPAPTSPAAGLPSTASEVVTPSAPDGVVVKVVDTDPDVIVQYMMLDGILQAVTEEGAPALYQLMTPEMNRLQQRICYLESNQGDLDRYEGKHVRLSGNERWRKGDRYPVLVIDHIGMVW